jgi:hypothetical protein
MIELYKARMIGADYVYILPWALKRADEQKEPWKSPKSAKPDGQDSIAKEAYKNALVVRLLVSKFIPLLTV